MQEIFDENHLYDDDQYINFNCNTKKNKISLIEKIFIFIVSFLSIPSGIVIYVYFNHLDSFYDNFANQKAIIFESIFFVLIYILHVFSEFAIKNFAIKKGIFTSTIVSFLLMFFIEFSFQTLFGLICSVSYSWVTATLISSGIYITLMLILRTILVIAYKHEELVLMIIGPKNDANKLAMNIIEKNHKDKKSKINQRGYFDAQLSMSDAVLGKQLALVQLYKALGGGWER